MERATSLTHPDHTRLTEEERYHLSILANMKLWTTTALARAFGVNRKTVANCMARYPISELT